MVAVVAPVVTGRIIADYRRQTAQLAELKSRVRHILAKLDLRDRSTTFVGWVVLVSRKAPCHPYLRRLGRTPL